MAVGSVSERKGSDLLVEVGLRLAESHGAHTYFAGNIDWDEPQRLADQSPVADHIHFLGFQSDPRWLLTGATVFVLASRRDPAPLVLIEALEAGLPIVATTVDGVPELLANGGAGLLTPPEDVDALTAAVRKLLDSELERVRLARAAVHRSAELAVERVCADYRSVYGEQPETWARRMGRSPMRERSARASRGFGLSPTSAACFWSPRRACSFRSSAS